MTERGESMTYFPVPFSIHGVDVCKPYVAELRKIKTAEALKEFATRWHTVFEAPFPNKNDGRGLGNFDAEEALNCIVANRKGICAHLESNNPNCAGGRLVLPELFLRATVVAEECKVPFNLALYRLLDVGANGA